jgi:hypothetical protein
VFEQTDPRSLGRLLYVQWRNQCTRVLVHLFVLKRPVSHDGKQTNGGVSGRVLQVSQESGSLISRGSSAGTLRGHLIETGWRRLPDRGTDRQ